MPRISRPLSAALAGLAGLILSSQPSRAEPDAVKFVIPTVSLTFTAAYVAEDAGLWQKEGLSVTVLHILGLGAMNAVISGSAEFAQNTAGGFTRAAVRGQRLLAIANLIDRPMMELVIRKDIALAAGFDAKAPLALRGKILAGHTFSAGAVNSILHGYLKIVARRAGIDPERDVRMAPMEESNVFPSFRSKAIDGFVLSQPWTAQVVRDGDAVVVASSPNGDLPELVPFGYNLLVTRPEVCAKRREVCVKMGRAMTAAARFIHDHPRETAAILKKRFAKVDDDLIATSLAAITKATPLPPIVNRADLENADTYNVAAGLMREDERLSSYEGLYTSEFVH